MLGHRRHRATQSTSGTSSKSSSLQSVFLLNETFITLSGCSTANTDVDLSVLDNQICVWLASVLAEVLATFTTTAIVPLLEGNCTLNGTFLLYLFLPVFSVLTSAGQQLMTESYWPLTSDCCCCQPRRWHPCYKERPSKLEQYKTLKRFEWSVPLRQLGSGGNNSNSRNSFVWIPIFLLLAEHRKHPTAKHPQMPSEWLR